MILQLALYLQQQADGFDRGTVAPFHLHKLRKVRCIENGRTHIL